MPLCLLDVNVLIALAWVNHEHHATAARWFAVQSTIGWATCPVTQIAFVRLSSNPTITGTATSPSEAASMLHDLTQKPNHIFWKDEIPFPQPDSFIHRLKGHRQITDAYLFTLAVHLNGSLATFDQGIASLALTPQEKAAIVLISK
jgi:uncharacterized protein